MFGSKRNLLIISILIGVAGYLIYSTPPGSPKEAFAVLYNKCADQSISDREKGECLKNLAETASRAYQLQEIEDGIRNINDSYKLQWCHEFMHYLGWETLSKTKTISKAFELASGLCDSGMYHGIVEEYINQAELSYDPETFTKNIIYETCEESINNSKNPVAIKGLCYHGLGHAFMFITENKLNNALEYCDRTKSPNGCYTGAFMENIQTKQIARFSHQKELAFQENDPDYPCKILNNKYKDTCYLYKGINNLVATGGDVKKAFELCLKVASKYKNICFRGTGSNIPGPHETPKGAGEKCLLSLQINKTAYEECIKGAMSFLVQVALGSPEAVAEFCETIKEEQRNLCYAESGDNLNLWVTENETLADKCNKLPTSDAKNLCLNGR
ncbi:MAG TPA: hypothetical protein VI432_01980 [Candidatus Paceibacterota bacterium]